MIINPPLDCNTVPNSEWKVMRLNIGAAFLFLACPNLPHSGENKNMRNVTIGMAMKYRIRQ